MYHLKILYEQIQVKLTTWSANMNGIPSKEISNRHCHPLSTNCSFSLKHKWNTSVREWIEAWDQLSNFFFWMFLYLQLKVTYTYCSIESCGYNLSVLYRGHHKNTLLMLSKCFLPQTLANQVLWVDVKSCWILVWHFVSASWSLAKWLKVSSHQSCILNCCLLMQWLADTSDRRFTLLKLCSLVNTWRVLYP